MVTLINNKKLDVVSVNNGVLDESVYYRLLCFPAGKHKGLNHDTPTHRPLNQHYIIYHQIDLYFHVTQTDPEAP
jgi:hypothetical protein